jgi:dTDP-4-amino-4,6-dideoxygalactose transaminase
VKVPFIDLRAQLASIRPEIDAAIARVLDDHSFILGEHVARFEAAFAGYTGRRYCVGLNSGTSALHVALLRAGVGPGDEVVTTPFTWISTAWAISYCGARPVWADIDPDTGNLDPAAAECAITSKTAALLAVDLYGNPADLPALEHVARRHTIPLIEDAAQAHGARLRGRRAGSWGLFSCFSFYPSKNLSAVGEAGAVVTDDADLAQSLRELRDHAQATRHLHVEVGYNYRMEGLQGAVLDVKLRHLDRWNASRCGAADRYDELLADIPEVIRPHSTPGAEPVWHLYVVRVPHRDRVAELLREHGVDVGIHYPTPAHLQPAYAALGHRRGDFPAAERFAAECLSLPMFPEITLAQQTYVAGVLRNAVQRG